MRLRLLLVYSPLILSACSASVSDIDRVRNLAKDQLDQQINSAELIANQYASAITTSYEGEPYFNPYKPIPDYYALQLDNIGVQYPQHLVYHHEDYWFYKDAKPISKGDVHEPHSHEH